uniref:Uncharacterized protein LOC101243229 n=1 Tax=Phallusia mammillata TaxID=59560 RepID=A0A6F9DIU0_9ASCI|nr:uncharacterized protein LOC101243229 [Phallusia mammillata]
MPIEIHFSHKSAVFRPGDCVTGYVIVISQSSSRSDGIELEWKGRVNIMNRNNQQASFLVFRTAQVLNHSDSEAEGNDREIRIPFKHRLPNPIPPSHMGASSYASVRYSVEATLRREWEDGVIKLSTEKSFSVVTVKEIIPSNLKQVKLNHHVRAMMCCCCLFPSIEVGLAINKRAFYPGEDVLIQMAVVNNSGSEIVGVNLKLLQLVSIVCNAGYSYQRSVVQELNLHQIVIPSNRSPYSMPMKKIPVPAVSPTYDTGNDILSMKYEIQCIICLPSFYDDLILTLPVVIGTYPEALGSLMRKMPTLPPKGTILRPAPNADLDSPDFASSIEEVSTKTSLKKRNPPSPQTQSSSESSDSEVEFPDPANGIVNPGYQASSFSENPSADSPSTKRQRPRMIMYEEVKEREWVIRYARCGTLPKVVKEQPSKST